MIPFRDKLGNRIWKSPDELSTLMLGRVYLMSSYLYYILDKNVVTDYDYDSICSRLLEKFEELEKPYCKIIKKDALQAGTGYNIRVARYTNRMCLAAQSWYNDSLDDSKVDVSKFISISLRSKERKKETKKRKKINKQSRGFFY